MKTTLKRTVLLLAAIAIVSLCACTLIPSVPEVSDSPSPTPSDTEKPGELPGYWAALTETGDSVFTLEGYYLSPEGTGLKFTSSEGAFEVTSYLRNESYVTIYFLNMDGEAVRDNCRIDKLTDRTLVLTSEDGVSTTYIREEKIESTSGTGTYIVTQTDGTVITVDGGPAEVDLETIAAITQYLQQYGGMPLFMEPNQIDTGWIVRKFYYIETNDTGREDYEFFTPLSSILEAAQQHINPELELPSPANPSMYDSEVLRWNSKEQGFDWNPSDNPETQHEYLIESSRIQGGVYTIVCVEFELYWQETEEGKLDGMILLDGQVIGTIDINDSGDYEYNYIANKDALPRTTFILRDGAADDSGARTFVFERKYKS
ncbi:MAG: hypothetical protein LBO63_01700 [Oscillospiraceae bacterium]|jgi:hypothetical protein|nr:hypothetical protein [Oscillospiraceae bacterium]